MTAQGRPRWRDSLGLRLVLLFLLLALAITVIGAGGLQRAMGSGWRALVRPLVADYVDRLAAEIGTPPSVERARALAQRLPLVLRIDGPQVRWDSRDELPPPGARPGPDGRPGLWTPAPDGRPPPPLRALADDGPDPEGMSERMWLRQVRLTADGHRLVFGLGDVPWRHRPRAIGWGTLAVVVALTLLAYAMVRRWLRPLGVIGAGVQRYGQGRFDQPIGLRRRDEFGQLGEQVDTMAARLHGMLEAKRTLLLAISHELRSPLTRARLNAELLEETPARDALVHDLEEMRQLIGDLLETERLAAGHAALQCAPVDLVALVREVVESTQLNLAAEDESLADAQITLDLPAAALVLEVDAARWRVLVRNLVANALRHGRGADGEPARVTVSLALEGAAGPDLRLSVRDHGPGVPAEELPRLAEAFYRPGADRGRRGGGVGLGLALCRLIAQAHGGQLQVSRAEPGLRVSVSCPARRASASPGG